MRTCFGQVGPQVAEQLRVRDAKHGARVRVTGARQVRDRRHDGRVAQRVALPQEPRGLLQHHREHVRLRLDLQHPSRCVDVAISASRNLLISPSQTQKLVLNILNYSIWTRTTGCDLKNSPAAEFVFPRRAALPLLESPPQARRGAHRFGSAPRGSS